MQRSVHRMPQVMPRQPIRPDKKSRPYTRFGLSLILAGLVVGLLWFFLAGPYFAVQQVEVVGVDNPSIKAIADRLHGRNMFRLKGTAVEQEMTQAYPPIGSVQLVRGLPRTVRVKITLRQPALRWQVGDTIYVIDDHGNVFEQGDKPEYTALPKIIDKSGVSLQVGQEIVVPQFIQFVQDIDQKVPPLFKRNITSLEVTETIFHLDVVLDGDVRLRLTTQRPLQEQLDGAVAIATAHSDAKQIDVRVPKWGYWK